MLNKILFPPPKRLLLMLAAFSALLLSGALAGQYGLGWHPCELCLLQRYPYVAIFALALPGALLLRSPTWQRRLVWVCLLLLAADFAIAAYHAGVEWGIFKGPDACSSDTQGGQTIEAMRAAIMNAPLVTCQQAMAYIAGLSLAAWNALAAFAMLALGLNAMRRKA